MNTTKKLWLGFGTLSALLAVSTMLTLVWLRSLEADLQAVTKVAEPMRAAAYEMEINVHGAGMAAFSYLHTGDPTRREQVALNRTEFVRFKAQFDRLATTSKHKELSQRVGDLHREFADLAEFLMDRKDDGVILVADVRRLTELRIQLDGLLGEDIQSLADQEFRAAQVTSARRLEFIQFAALLLLVGGLLIAVVLGTAVGMSVTKVEEAYRITLTSICDGVIATDADGRVSILNPIAEQLTGWRKDEAVGTQLEKVFRIVNEETRQPVENPVMKVIAQGTIVGLANHTVLIGRDGTEHAIDNSAAPIRDARDRLLGVVMVFRDVTNLRRAERLLQDARAYAESIVETVREPLIVLTADLRVRSASRSFYRTFHVTPEETRDRLIYELGNGQWDLPQLRTLLEEILPANTSFHDFEVEADFPGIGRKAMLLNARRLYREDNHTELILLAIEDITDRKRAVDALQISEVRYRRLFESAKDGVLILDANTARITDANPFIGELLDCSPADLVGKELWEIGLFKDIEANKTAAQELREKGYIRYEDLPLETRMGRQIEVEFVSNVYHEDHRLVIQCSVRDITDRSRLERQLEEQAAVLKEADRRKSEFLAILAHELRNPLAPVRNAAHYLKLKGPSDPALQRAVAMIDRQVTHMAHLLDDLLDVSRISRGALELRREHLDLASVIEAVVEVCQDRVEQQSLTLAVTLPKEPVALDGDRQRIIQIFSNLILNSAKYTPAGGGIELAARKDGTDLEVSVKDNGMGIPGEKLTEIFDLFTQVDHSRQDGLGIGLTLVRQLVMLHGGTVEARSGGLGQGSEFIVRLPATTAAAAAAKTEPAVAGEKRRILIADDNLDAAESLALLLEAAGHDVHLAYDGLQALKTATTLRPEVALLDIGMPKMNGYEVARELRDQSWGKTMLLVALTGWGQEEDQSRAREAGFDVHLTKPVPIEVLHKLLATIHSSSSEETSRS